LTERVHLGGIWLHQTLGVVKLVNDSLLRGNAGLDDILESRKVIRKRLRDDSGLDNILESGKVGLEAVRERLRGEMRLYHLLDGVELVDERM
jgi:hypothetical protein